MTKVTNFFNSCNTLDEAKNLFKKLAFELHPDHRQDKQRAHLDFIELMRQFKAFRPTIKREGDEDFNHEAFYNLVKNFDKLKGVLVTFVGSFIWLEDEMPGATKDQKETIKKILLQGYNPPRFAFKRLKWYYSPEGYKQKFRSKKTFEQIKQTWGSKTYKPQREEKQARLQLN